MNVIDQCQTVAIVVLLIALLITQNDVKKLKEKI